MNKIGVYNYKDCFIELFFDPETLKFKSILSYEESNWTNTPQEALEELKLFIDFKEEEGIYVPFSKVKIQTSLEKLQIEMWSLDYTFAKYMLPRVLYFKIFHSKSIPGEFMTIDPFTGEFFEEYVDDWEEILGSIILSLRFILEDKSGDKEYQGTIDYGLKLFSKYIQHLWI